jgi:hypothetical protein
MTATRPPATAAQASLYQTLKTHLTVLKLDACAEALPRVLDEAAAEKLTVTATLERLLAIEVDTALARRLIGRLRFACLPTPATLDDFDYDAQPGVDRALINELGTCRYLDTATNVILIGPPGVGKPTSRSASHDKQPPSATAPTSPPPPPTSPPDATSPRSKDAGQQPCDSSLDPHSWSSTNSATYHTQQKPHPRCSKSSPSAT